MAWSLCHVKTHRQRENMPPKKYKKYLYKAHKIEATSKEAVMRRFGLPMTAKSRALITIIKPMGETK